MWMFLQYLKDMYEDAIPFIYAVCIVTLLLLVLGWAL
jgi:hypothetical protein